MSCALCQRPLVGLTSTSQKLTEEREGNIIPHQQQSKASTSQIAPNIYPPGYDGNDSAGIPQTA